MATYSSIAIIPLTFAPGASVHVKKPSHGRREELQALLTPALNELTKARAAMEKLRAEVGMTDDMDKGAAEKLWEGLTVEQQKALNDAAIARQVAANALDDGYCEFGFVKIEDFTLDGIENPTREQIRSLADPQIYSEIALAAKMQFVLSDEERARFESLSTSGAVEDGKANSMTANGAENPGPTSTETADSTSQS